jgi:uncharacterized protein YndB with AHSA1/START domain
VQNDGDRWTLVFVRELRHSPEAVWRALSDPAALQQWSPFDADRNLGTTGKATLTMAGGEGDVPTADDVMAIEVRHADAPRLLEYTWAGDILRWELEPIAIGTRLTLRHTVEDRTWIPRVTAGWHLCIDVLEHMLDGDPVGRIVGNEAKRFGWEELHESYAAMLS